MSEREEKLRAFFANPTQELFDIGTKKASIELYVDYWDEADYFFMSIVLKKQEDDRDIDYLKFFNIVDIMIVINHGLLYEENTAKILEEKEKDKAFLEESLTFWDWEYFFDSSDKKDVKKISFEKMFEIAKKVKSDPELWIRLYTSSHDDEVKKMIEEEVKSNDATFEQWLSLFKESGFIFVFNKVVETAKTYDEWSEVLYWARENEDKKNIELALSGIVKCLN